MERQHARIAALRLVLGLAGVGLLIWLGLAPWKTLLALVVLFAVIALGHGRLINARDRARSAVSFYERGIKRLEHRWMGQGDAGERFLPAHHLYAADLDVFGRGSLFELVATCRTEAGRSVLAQWMLAPAGADEIRARQDAVRELQPDIDLREHLAVEGDEMRATGAASPLHAWALTGRVLPGPAVEAVVRVMPLVLLGCIVWDTQGGSSIPTLVVLAVQGLIALALRPRVRTVVDAVDTASRDLDVCVGVARLLEHRSDTAVRLHSLRAALGTGSERASSSIGRLAQWVALLSSRSNVIFGPIAGLVMWTTQMAFSIERWRARHGRHVPQWLDAIAEFDALCALAGYAAEHPAYVFPELDAPTRIDMNDAPARLEAVDVAHPLLPASAVSNSIMVGGASPSLYIVSGSNMSGKSTFLRTLGINVVLAQMGAPVRAASFRLSPLHVGASIRVLDSLQEGHSRFYAEILRLKHIVDLARLNQGREKGGGATLFLLDEVLSGTNSHDRRQGAEGLLRGLIGLGAIGLATTHDLALGEIAEGWSPQATNVHFADAFDGGSLAFDYVLREGPVRTSNALELMRSIGLDVDPI
jgi:hypothetical protein